jgi:hypothetical protein
MSSGTKIVSLASTASIGVPAATLPSSGSSTARTLISAGTSSSARLRFQARLIKPFSCRLVRCLWTVASEERPKWSPISSIVGA